MLSQRLTSFLVRWPVVGLSFDEVVGRDGPGGAQGRWVAALAGRNEVIIFVELPEIPPTQADILHRLAEHLQIAVAVEGGNGRTRIRRLPWLCRVILELKPPTRVEVRAWIERWLVENPPDFQSPRASSVIRESPTMVTERYPSLSEGGRKGRQDEARQSGGPMFTEARDAGGE